jgi:sugar phosphate isomerase/epimerase
MYTILSKSLLRIITLSAILAAFSLAAFAQGKPDSKVKGVQIGTITYSYRSMQDQSLESILNYIVKSGISSVELMGSPVEAFAGIPQTKDEEVIKKWRKEASMDKFKEVRKLFNKQGVKIHILKLGNPKWSDEEIDYAFNAAKAVGAKGISMEISEETAQRMAPFADKHKMYVILHNHGQPGKPGFSFDKILAHGERLMLNFDVGHYYGATGDNPVNVINRLHKRIVSLHIKDKTGPKASDPDKNQPFGSGQTPLAEILQTISKNKWPIHADVELEYTIPSGSDAVTEVGKCVDHLRKLLEQNTK